MICLLVITDGRRECLSETIASAAEALAGPITRRVLVDDSADPLYWAWCDDRYGEDWEVIHHDMRRGFGGAIASGWAAVLSGPERLVFHLEDDFVFLRRVALGSLVEVLDRRSHVVQLALRRQPVNAAEADAGGVIEQHPDDYAQCTDGQRVWLEHRRYFTTNPSLYRSSLCERGWPEGPDSEGRFGLALFAADAAARSAYWGPRDGGEWVRHIGHRRHGTGY